MFKWFICCTILLFYAHHHVIHTLTGRIQALELNMTYCNQTSQVLLKALELLNRVDSTVNDVTGRINALEVTEYENAMRLKERVDNIDLRMSALENTIKQIISTVNMHPDMQIQLNPKGRFHNPEGRDNPEGRVP